MGDRIVTLDKVAQLLAADAGVAWRELPDYPGFSKGRWRDQARWLIRRDAPAAHVVEGRIEWDGRTGEDVVRNFSVRDLLRVLEARKFSR